jgi:structure-specific endonuclease subunit SLX1
MDTKSRHLCYVITSCVTNRTYCGYTNRFKHRIRCHNGEITGGAKYTRVGRPWKPIFIVNGFQTKVQALCFEYSMKHTKVKQSGIMGRVKKLEYVINKEKWTSKCAPSHTIPLTITWYQDEYMNSISYPDHVKAKSHQEQKCEIGQ